MQKATVQLQVAYLVSLQNISINEQEIQYLMPFEVDWGKSQFVSNTRSIENSSLAMNNKINGSVLLLKGKYLVLCLSRQKKNLSSKNSCI